MKRRLPDQLAFDLPGLAPPRGPESGSVYMAVLSLRVGGSTVYRAGLKTGNYIDDSRFRFAASFLRFFAGLDFGFGR